MGSPNGCCQCEGPQGERQLPSASPDTLEGQRVDLSQALLPWAPGHVGFCVCPLRMEGVFVSHSPLALEKCALQNPNILGLVFLVQDSRTREPDVGLDLSLLMESSCSCDDPPICGSPTRGCGY